MIFRKRFFIYIFFTPLSYAVEINRSTRKAGIEIEITNLKYNEKAEKLRHKKIAIICENPALLEESKDSNLCHDNNQLGHIEIDGASKNLEFVSKPFNWNSEEPKLKTFLESLVAFSEKIQNFENAEIILKKNDEDLYKNGIFLNEDIRLLKTQNDTALKLNPQITFQIPLNKVMRFLQYFSENEDKKKQIFTFKKHPNQSSFFTILQSQDKLDHSNEEGLFLLVNLYIHFLNEQMSGFIGNEIETGLKPYLPIMSRIAFSKMYSSLSEQEQTNFKKLTEELSKNDEKLIKNPYPRKKITWITNNSSMETLKITENLTISDWINSIIDPKNIKDKKFFQKEKWDEKKRNKTKIIEQLKNEIMDLEKDTEEQKKHLNELNEKKTRLLNSEMEIEDTKNETEDTKNEREVIKNEIESTEAYQHLTKNRIQELEKKIKHKKKQIETSIDFSLNDEEFWETYIPPTNNAKDLLSPPLSYIEDDSMGALDDLLGNPKDTVLEVRAYGNIYNNNDNNIKNIKEFITSEINNVKSTID